VATAFDVGSHSRSDATAAAGGAAPAPQWSNRPPPVVENYEVLGELGRGAMGIVYRARQILLNRPCVLKMILAGAHADAEAVLRFLAEAEAVARLQHPNIVQIHNIGQADGLPYFELEYVDGGSLDRRLDGTPWPARQAAELVESLARGVAEAHRLGIVHRDLKPANVLLAGDGTPKIADFGLAKSLDRDSGLTRTDSVMGSPSYMAPEQAAGLAKHVGPLADVYALGAILYELLTGRPPFRGTTVLDTLEQVKSMEPVRPSRLVPGLQRDAETIALKCLQKEPAKRYDSAAALAADLRRFLAREPIVARPVPFWERGAKWARRRPAIAALTTAVFLLAAAILTLGVVSYERIEDALRVAEERRKAAEKSQREALKQSKAAEANFARARKAVDDSFTIVSESKLFNVPGLRALRAELLGSSMRYYDEFLKERVNDTSLQKEMLVTRVRVADVLRELGRTNEANAAYEEAITGFESALRLQPDDLDLKTGLADAQYWAVSAKSPEKQTAIFREIVALREAVLAGRHSDRASKHDLALACSRLYERLKGPSPAEALVFLERSVVLRLEVAEELPDDADAMDGVFESFFKVARAMGSKQSLGLYERALEFGGESLRLRPNDLLTANDFQLASQELAAVMRDMGQSDEAIAALRRSVNAIGDMARANEDTPRIQEIYLSMSRHLADRLADLKRRDDAVGVLLDSRTALERFPRETAVEMAGVAERILELTRRIGEIKPDLAPEQKTARDVLLDCALSEYKAAVAAGWSDLGVLKGATPLKNRPGYSEMLAEAESGANSRTPISRTPAKRANASTVSRPKVDIKLDRARTQAALGVVRARCALVKEAIATMQKSCELFDELVRDRPADANIRRSRVSALGGFHVELLALAQERRWRGKADEEAVAQAKAGDYYAELSRGRPDDPEVDAVRRQVQQGLAELRKKATQWGETYSALRKSESSAREAGRRSSDGRTPDQNAVATLARVGYGYGKLALWDEAAAAFSKAYEMDPVGLQTVEGEWDNGFGTWYRVAVLQLQSGDSDGYERLREKLLQQNVTGDRRDPLDQIRIATLRPDPRSDWKQIVELAEKFPDQHPWDQTVKGFALLRAGRAQEALDRFKKAPDWINAWPARAIAHHRLGETALAREWLIRADQHIRDDLDEAIIGTGFTQSGWVSWWDDWLLRLIWTREAHELIDGNAWPDPTWMKQQRARVLARIDEAK
jgi:serine/threonine protein kinase